MKERNAETAVEESMAAINSNSDAAPEVIMGNILTLISAMTFGNGHFDGAYKHPDNDWLGVTGTIDEQSIESAIQYRLQKGMAGHATGKNPLGIIPLIICERTLRWLQLAWLARECSHRARRRPGSYCAYIC